MICINCHKTVSDNLDFCPHCKCRLKAPVKKQQSARKPVNPPSVSSNPVRKTPPATQPRRPANPTSVSRQQPAKPPVHKQPPAPAKPPVRQTPRSAPARPAPPTSPKKKPKELGGFNNLMAYFILPAFIIFDLIVIFSILNSLSTSEHQTSGIFTVCAQTVHLICAVVASHGLKMKTFSSLISLLLCVGVTVIQTAVSFILFSKDFDKLSLFMMLATAAITILLTIIFVPYYIKHKKEFDKNDILFD